MTDNNAAAHSLAHAMISVLSCEPRSLKTPPSWIRLYGEQMEKELAASIF